MFVPVELILLSIGSYLYGWCYWSDSNYQYFKLLTPALLAVRVFRKNDPFREKIFRAVCLAWLGDYFLMTVNSVNLLAGIYAFSLTQVNLIEAFTGDSFRSPIRLALVGLFIYNLLTVWLLENFLNLGELSIVPIGLAVGAYVPLLLQAWVSSWYRWLSMVGMTLFVISDAILAVDLFVMPIWQACSVVIITYWLGLGLVVVDVTI